MTRHSRRSFLKAAFASGLAMMLEGTSGSKVFCESTTALRPKIMCAFIRFKERFRMGWPGADYDVDLHQKHYMQMLLSVAGELKIDIVTHEMPISDAASADALIKRIKSDAPDGVVLINLTRYLWDLINKLSGAASPTIIFSPIGTSFAPQALPLANKTGVVVLSTVEFESIKRPLTAIKAAWLLRNSRMLVIRGEKQHEAKLSKWGTVILNEIWERYPNEIERTPIDSTIYKLADAYRRTAKELVEPSVGDLIEAARVCVACERMLKEANANAITMDCLPHVRGRTTPPPCVAWSRFLDMGIPAGCEADIMATLTLMLTQHFLGRPGFIGNPVAETERNWFIVAHCTAPTKLYGTQMHRASFLLRSHAESGRGVAIQTLFPQGEPVTILRFLREDQLLLGTGSLTANLPHPPAGGCRTMIAIALDEPKDIRMLRDFHHPVVVVGNFKRELEMFCQMFSITPVPLQKV
ncbi:MAG: hypothetical protein RMK18_05375 [Armatimonadota bacterium]|nr:hypothetical protein [Armatimonadota bacterium]MCX7777960.1 hypothetical protein [Armatimonadota bacterium]MDW8025283.1 hypothetical protein [Armatimonadota bacterium]